MNKEPLGAPHIRAASIHLENNTIGDGHFVKEIAATLRELADMIDAGVAGWETAETFTSKGGTRLFIIGATWRGHALPRKLGDRPW
jgi:hypothetical protein